MPRRKSRLSSKHLKANAIKRRFRRAAESSSEREQRRARNAAAMRARRQNETSTERAQRLAQNAAANRARRHKKQNCQLKCCSTGNARKRYQETEEMRLIREREERLARNAAAMRLRRQNETPIQRARRLEQNAASIRARRRKKALERLLVRCGAGAGNGSWDVTGGMDQITVVRIDDTHITEEQVNPEGAVCYEMECTIPAEDDEEEDFVIEYSNPEDEESHQFTMSVDRSVPAKKPIVKHPIVEEHSGETLPVMPKPEPR